MKNRILAVALVLSVLLSLAACKGDAVQPSDATQLQATETEITGETAKPSEEGTGATGSEGEAPKESTEDLTEDSKATEESSSAPTEPATETTAPATQPTQPTQPTTPVVTEPPHQHSYTTTVIAPTCNDKGYTKHTCSCGDSYKDNYTDALGHHYIDEVIAPTSTEKGYTKHTCDRCWYSYNDTYTDPVKQVYDINAAMEAGNAYALSIGFACIDYSLTPSNAGYYPYEQTTGEVIALLGGQSWFEQEMRDCAQDTANDIDAIRGEGRFKGCACRTYITYDAATDTYTWYFLYA